MTAGARLRAGPAAGSLRFMTAVAVLVAIPLAPAVGGTIETARTGECDVRLAGEIDAGDADKLVAALRGVNQNAPPGPRQRNENEIERDIYIPRLCLNSKGGRFDEAVKFLRATMMQLSFATVIESGAECYSACALMFLGGHLNQGDGYFELYRRLDAGGKLGFHAPYIPTIAAGASDKLLSASYRAGVSAVGELLNLNGLFFPRSLLSEFLRVGPEDFFRIEKVGQLAAWSIGLTGYPRPASVGEKQIGNVCNNQRMRDNNDFVYPILMLRDRDEWEANGDRGAKIPLGDGLARRIEPTIEGVAGCTVLVRLHEGILFLSADTRGADAGNAEPPGARQRRDSFVSRKVSENIQGTEPDSYTPAFFVFPEHTNIASLGH